MRMEELPPVSDFRRHLAYFWFTFVMRVTGWLPDVTPVCRLRGRLLKGCFRSCGHNLQVQRDVEIKTPYWVDVGRDVLLAQGCWINGLIALEDEVLLAPYVVLSGGNHSRLDGSYRFGAPDVRPIRIGRGAWIGTHATITPGVTIGRGAAVGANAVVTHDVADGTIVGGIPARPLEARGAEQSS